MLALTPILVFLLVYLVTALCAGDFYAMPITMAFLTASIYSITLLRGPIEKRIEAFSRGAMQPTTLLMIWIFILAGVFAQTARQMGAIDSLVGLLLMVLPSQAVPVSMFIAACLVSMSVGTSVGTIVTLVPIAVGLAQGIGMPVELMAAIVVGGAYFGDNLSFISDTTIVATTSQGCKMNDKFKFNIWIAIPAALLCIMIYLIIGAHYASAADIPVIRTLTIVPYLLVLATALMGLNVMLVLFLGVLSSLAVALLTGELTFLAWCQAGGEGIMGMSELIIVVLMASGIMEVIRQRGGIDYIVNGILRHIHSRRTAELSSMFFIWLVNLCTANNTVTLITVSDVVRQVSKKYGIDPRRMASLMDTSSCVIQGVLPYGAQMLMASALINISPLEIIPHLYYIFALTVMLLLSIIFQFPKAKTYIS